MLRREIRDFLQFVRRPTFGPRLPRQPMPALAADWIGSINPRRIMRWVLLLWAVNFLVLGPLAAAVALSGGASHRFNSMVLPWFLALVWAPIMEELMFRLGLRRPGAALWLIPAFTLVVMHGQQFHVGAFMALSLALLVCPRPMRTKKASSVTKLADTAQAMPNHGPAEQHARRAQLSVQGVDTVASPYRPTTPGWQPLLPGVRFGMRWNRRFRRVFPVVFHVATFTFAILHLLNFSLAAVPWWLLPFLVLPQWVTGLVLGWLRVRTGIGASIVAHSLFNAGPLTVVWLMMQTGVS